MADNEDILATVNASPGRRILGVGGVWLLAGIVLWVAVTTPPALGWQVFLLAVGGSAIWLAERMRRATALRLELTETELRDSGGTVIARTDDIIGLDRGIFAFKPSNGFLLKLRQAEGRVWRPGLWWRLGNRVGIGGMTPGHQAKVMAEVISAMVATREG
ncbi:MAG: hypothetical protein AAGL96_12100 [Pseudomonadota bacterium]